MPAKLTLTPQASAAICARVRKGLPLTLAAPAAGVPWDSAKRWLRKGRQGVEPFASFVRNVDAAKAQWAQKTIGRIDRAGREDWRAAAYLLERRIPGFYKPDQRAGVDDDKPDRVILLYPVPMPLGAEPAPLPKLPGQVLDVVDAIDVEGVDVDESK